MRPTESSCLLSTTDLNASRQRRSRFGALNNMLGDGARTSEVNMITADPGTSTRPINLESMQLSRIEDDATEPKHGGASDLAQAIDLEAESRPQTTIKLDAACPPRIG